MTDGNQESSAQLLRELYFNRTGIVFLVMTLVSVLMLLASAKTHGSVSQFWLAVGSATIATTGYSSVQILLTTRQFNRFLLDSIRSSTRDQITESTNQAMETFRSSRSRYLPSRTYPPQSTPNPDFNRDLNASLSNSSRYIFRGMSARYAIARLALLSPPPRDVKLIVADPTKPAAVDFRARHEAGSGDEEAFTNAKRKILEGIHMSIAGAYQIRHKFDNLDFYFTPIPHVDRVEICDTDIYFTRFSDTSGTGRTFPATARFDHESLIYQMFFSDCSSLLSSPYLRKLSVSGIPSVPGVPSERRFIDQLKELNIITEDEEWERMTTAYNLFREQVRAEIRP